jgi:hypothetical protein
MPTVDNDNCEVNLEKIGNKYAHTGTIQELNLDKVKIKLRVGKTSKGLPVGELIQGFERNFSEEGNDPTTDAYQKAEAEFKDADIALDALESLILAHACEGIDVASEAYQNGIQTALDACANNL